MRWVDTTQLPTYEGSTQIDWSKTVGMTMPFVYDGIKGKLTILGYTPMARTTTRLTLKYEDRVHVLSDSSIRLGNINRLLCIKKLKPSEFKSGQIIKNDRTHIKILDERNVRKDGYTERGFTYICLDCGHEGYKTVAQLRKGSGCKYALCRKKRSASA